MRFVLIAWMAAAASGCGLGYLVHPGDALNLGGDALVALAVHPNEYATLTFCRDADYASCLTTGMIGRDQPVQLYAVPPGRYCLLEILIDAYSGAVLTVHHRILPEESRCFLAIADGGITYPGDLDIDARPSEGSYWRVASHWSPRDDIAQRVYAEYPNVRSLPIEDATPTRIPPPSRAPQ